MRIAILGSTGFVGAEFMSQGLLNGFELFPIQRSACNVYDVEQLTRYLRSIAPDFLINCAGYTGKPNVDACEKDKANCLAGNAVLPGVIAEACNNLGVTWGHVSSGCIFTGRRADGLGFNEFDPPNFSFRQNNCSFYSGTKAIGEEILAGADRCYIWRLRIPFFNVDTPRNYLTKLMRYHRLLQAENSLSNLNEFVAACFDCFGLGVPFGTYNLTNPGSVTTREVVQMIKEHGICDKEYDFFETEQEFMSVAALTPRSNCVLDSSKAIGAGLSLSHVRDSLAKALGQWHPSNDLSVSAN